MIEEQIQSDKVLLERDLKELKEANQEAGFYIRVAVDTKDELVADDLFNFFTETIKILDVRIEEMPQDFQYPLHYFESALACAFSKMKKIYADKANIPQWIHSGTQLSRNKAISRQRIQDPENEEQKQMAKAFERFRHAIQLAIARLNKKLREADDELREVTKTIKTLINGMKQFMPSFRVP